MKYNNLIIIAIFTFLIFSCSSKVKNKKYSDAIPILNNELLIIKDDKKWGVVDRNGNQIIPFICDGVKELSDSLGIASIYSGSYSLNTGVPRYVYCGKYFLFTKTGKTNSKEKNFSIVIEYRSDFHNRSSVLETPNRFLPSDTITNNNSCENLIFLGMPK